MRPLQSNTVSNSSEKYHMQAIDCCNQAAVEHSFAAKACAAGDYERAEEHTKSAHSICTKAQDLGRQASAS